MNDPYFMRSQNTFQTFVKVKIVDLRGYPQMSRIKAYIKISFFNQVYNIFGCLWDVKETRIEIFQSQMLFQKNSQFREIEG